MHFWPRLLDLFCSTVCALLIPVLLRFILHASVTFYVAVSEHVRISPFMTKMSQLLKTRLLLKCWSW